MEDLRSPMDGVNRLYQELDARVSDNGGLDNLFALHEKLRQSLNNLSSDELDTLLNEIHRSREALNRLQDQLIELRFLKEVLQNRARA